MYPEEICDVCHNARAQDDGMCIPCATHVRVNVAAGLQKFKDYLAKWAAFTNWEVSHK